MCLFPINAVSYYIEDVKSGELERTIKFTKNPDFFIEKCNFINPEKITIPCGKCVECLQNKSKEWSYRIMLESSLYNKNCFITLTYKENPITLIKRDYQLFLKRLRKFLSDDNIFIRYFGCGEYGSKNKRPHYHFIIFNWMPNDLIFLKKEKNYIVYRSPILEKIWNKGFVSVCELTKETAKYCSKYLQKLNTLPDNVLKPFLTMSLRPGIGLNAFLKKEDLYMQTDKLYHKGTYTKLPRYFIDKSTKYQYLDTIQKNRTKKSLLFSLDDKQLTLKRDFWKSKIKKII